MCSWNTHLLFVNYYHFLGGGAKILTDSLKKTLTHKYHSTKFSHPVAIRKHSLHSLLNKTKARARHLKTVLLFHKSPFLIFFFRGTAYLLRHPFPNFVFWEPQQASLPADERSSGKPQHDSLSLLWRGKPCLFAPQKYGRSVKISLPFTKKATKGREN